MSLLSDPTSINIMTESDLSNIISNFDYNIILDIIEENMNHRFNAINQLSNLPAACESVFKDNIQNLSQCGPYLNQIDDLRHNTYKSIIDIVCNKFNFSFNEECLDIYTASYCIFNLLISDYKNTISNFFTNYIIDETPGLYEGLGIGRFKKQKDSTTLYNKRSYEDQRLGLICSNLNFVLDNIQCFDIPFENVLQYIYKDDPTIAQYIKQNFTCNTDFYKSIIVPILNSSMKSNIITDIRIKIDSRGIVHRGTILDIQQSDEIEEE